MVHPWCGTRDRWPGISASRLGPDGLRSVGGDSADPGDFRSLRVLSTNLVRRVGWDRSDPTPGKPCDDAPGICGLARRGGGWRQCQGSRAGFAWPGAVPDTLVLWHEFEPTICEFPEANGCLT